MPSRTWQRRGCVGGQLRHQGGQLARAGGRLARAGGRLDARAV